MGNMTEPVTPHQMLSMIESDFITDQKAAHLTLIFGAIKKQHWLLHHDQPLTIGRGADCDICLPDSRVSRHHAQICWDSGHYFLVDMNSKNGTYINAERILTPTPLCDGDKCQIALCFTLMFASATSA